MLNKIQEQLDLYLSSLFTLFPLLAGLWVYAKLDDTIEIITQNQTLILNKMIVILSLPLALLIVHLVAYSSIQKGKITSSLLKNIITFTMPVISLFLTWNLYRSYLNISNEMLMLIIVFLALAIGILSVQQKDLLLGLGSFLLLINGYLLKQNLWLTIIIMVVIIAIEYFKNKPVKMK